MDAPSFYSSKGSENATAFVNGRVYTINDARPWAEAFIVDPDGKFEAVGSNEEIRSIAKHRGLVQYQLQGKFVMPGIHDAHTHLLAAGRQRLGEAHVGWESTDQTLAGNLGSAACACAYSNVMGNWTLGNFYQASKFADGIPDRKHLDKLYPDSPVLVREISCHRILVNSAGLRELGIDDDVKDPPGGHYCRRPDGTLTGEIVEAATASVWRSLPKTPLSYAKTVIEFAISECHRYGITSIQEASATTAYLHALRELEAENRLPLDISTHIVCAPGASTGESEASLAALINVADAFKSKHVHTGFVKFWLDGAPLPPNPTQCDLDANGKADPERVLVDYGKLFDRISTYDARNMTCKIHVAGEGSVRLALDVYEAVRKRNPSGPKHELAHCNAVHPGKGDSSRRCQLNADI
jgi:predicted amidohydrolase YtcJ